MDAIRNRRNAEDLNWRFRQNPLRSFEVLTAREKGDLLGYLVYSVIDQDAYIFDLFGRNLREIGPELLDALTSALRNTAVQTVRAQLPKASSLIPVFVKAGFSLRGDGARVVAFGEHFGHSPHETQWQFQHADLMA